MVYRTTYWHTNAFDPKMLVAISFVFTSITIGSLCAGFLLRSSVAVFP